MPRVRKKDTRRRKSTGVLLLRSLEENTKSLFSAACLKHHQTTMQNVLERLLAKYNKNPAFLHTTLLKVKQRPLETRGNGMLLCRCIDPEVLAETKRLTLMRKDTLQDLGEALMRFYLNDPSCINFGKAGPKLKDEKELNQKLKRKAEEEANADAHRP